MTQEREDRIVKAVPLLRQEEAVGSNTQVKDQVLEGDRVYTYTHRWSSLSDW